MFALKLLGLGRAVTGWVKAGVRWLFAKWHRAVIAGLIALCLWLWLVEIGRETSRADGAEIKLAAKTAEFEAFIRDAANAAQEAERRAIRNVERVRMEYAAKAEEASHENERLAADYRGRAAMFVRLQRTPANPGGTGGADLSLAAALPGGSVHDAGVAFVPVSDLDRCATGFAQLEALIGYVRSTSDVATVPPDDP